MRTCETCAHWHRRNSTHGVCGNLYFIVTSEGVLTGDKAYRARADGWTFTTRADRPDCPAFRAIDADQQPDRDLAPVRTEPEISKR